MFSSTRFRRVASVSSANTYCVSGADTPQYAPFFHRVLRNSLEYVRLLEALGNTRQLIALPHLPS